MINVMIATHNRPAMVRRALASVAAQTARDRIKSVLVSENGGNRESEAVCREFPELRIQYLFHEGNISAAEHGRILMPGYLFDGCTAILHDDDWWAPDHLANAWAALERHPAASVYYAGYFLVSGESSTLHCHENLPFWFAKGYPALDELWKLFRTEVALATLLATPGIYSAMVARTAALKESALAVHQQLRNPYDSDRMYVLKLAEFGPLLYNPLPEVFVRLHPGQDQRAFLAKETAQRMAATTQWIAGNSGAAFSELAGLFADLVERCPAAEKSLLADRLLFPWVLPAMVRWPDCPEKLVKLHQTLRHRQGSARSLFKSIVPPVLYPLIGATMRAFTRRAQPPRQGPASIDASLETHSPNATP